jgi:hypothetical protein
MTDVGVVAEGVSYGGVPRAATQRRILPSTALVRQPFDARSTIPDGDQAAAGRRPGGRWSWLVRTAMVSRSTGSLAISACDQRHFTAGRVQSSRYRLGSTTPDYWYPLETTASSTGRPLLGLSSVPCAAVEVPDVGVQGAREKSPNRAGNARCLLGPHLLPAIGSLCSTGWELPPSRSSSPEWRERDTPPAPSTELGSTSTRPAGGPSTGECSRRTRPPRCACLRPRRKPASRCERQGPGLHGRGPLQRRHRPAPVLQ